MDSGSTYSLVPASSLPKAIINSLDRTDASVSGIAGTKVKTLGEFRAIVSICGFELPNVKFIVMDTNIPILLGQNVWQHARIKSYNINNQDGSLTMTGTVNSTKVIGNHSLKVLSSPGNLSWSMSQPCYIAAEPVAEFDNENREPDVDPATLKTLDEKINWLKREMNMPLSHDNRAELEKFADLVIEYRSIFGVGTDQIGKFPREISIPTTGESRAATQHPIPEAHVDAVNKEIDLMLKAGVIETCEDPKGFRTPIVTVKKKDGSVRICLNFKATVNQVLVDSDSFPMDSTDVIFNKIRPGNKYFTSIDLLKGYWQIGLKEEDRHKTAFYWNGVCYQFCRLPFGLAPAGNSFARELAQVLRECELSDEDISVYLDDVTVHSREFSKFLSSHRKLFETFRRNGIKLNASKCEFLRAKVKFLGRIISSEGMNPDPSHIQGIMDIQPPRTWKQLFSLSGRLMWMRQFAATKLFEPVKSTSFSALMEPIFNLYRARKNSKTKFVWTEEANEALNRVKTRLTSPPFISFPDPKLVYTLTTDASNEACGAVLMQIQNGKFRIISTASKTFSPTQRRWSTTEREAFGIVWAVEKYETFLMDKPFVIFTDHKSLCYIDRKQFSNPKIANWQSKLARYRFSVQYLAGSQNVLADWLSRGDPAIRKYKKPIDRLRNESSENEKFRPSNLCA